MYIYIFFCFNFHAVTLWIKLCVMWYRLLLCCNAACFGTCKAFVFIFGCVYLGLPCYCCFFVLFYLLYLVCYRSIVTNLFTSFLRFLCDVSATTGVRNDGRAGSVLSGHSRRCCQILLVSPRCVALSLSTTQRPPPLSDIISNNFI